MLRVATYNIRKCIGLDWRRSPERIMRVLGEIEADVVALQEADRRLGQRPATLPVAELTARTGLRPVPIPASGRSSGWHGNALLIREGIDVERAVPLDLPSLEPRGALVADLDMAGVRLRVAGVHFGLRRADRRRQARALMEALHGFDGAMATVVLGDFNEWVPRGAASEELSKRFRQAPPVASFHSSAPLAALDRIFVCPGLKVTSAQVHRSATARRASDHLPVWADIGRAENRVPAPVDRREPRSAPSAV